MSQHILVVLEHEAHGLRAASAALLAPAATLARELSGSAAAVVCGVLRSDLELTEAPIAKCYVASTGDPKLLSHAVDVVIAAAHAERADVVLISETTRGRELAGAVAAKLGAAVLTSAHALTVQHDRVTVQASKLGGSALITCAAKPGIPVVILVRPNALREEAALQPLTINELPIEPRKRDVVVAEQRAQSDERIALEEADVIVSGGRGLGGPEAFTGILAELASVVQGAVGASRAAVDAGWAPHAQQVGQTGKTVRPRLYFAVAISGAIQHRVGMQTAGTIVAINKDANIPLADIADLLVIGDAFSLVPELTRQLRQQKGLL